MSSVLAALMLVAAPPVRVWVATAATDPASVEAVRWLSRELGRDPRLSALENASTTSPPVDALDTALVEQALDRGREAYTRLEPQQALLHLGVAETTLRPWLHQASARVLLAQVLRLRGLTELFLERPANAAQTFVSASFLEPEFSPASEEWPPEARLLYADAIANLKRLAPGALSVRVTPESAAVLLDGRVAATGPTTIRGPLPGEHALLVLAPGFKPFAGVVTMAADGHLGDAAVFLEPLPEPQRRHDFARYLAARVGATDEAMFARQVAAGLGVDAILLVTRPGAEADPVALWPFDKGGARLQEPAPISMRAGAAQPVIDRIVTAAGLTPAPPGPLGESVPPAATLDPWYLRWYSIAGVAAIVVGALATGVWLSYDSADEVTFVLGRAR
ncbi:MAG: PEGA domain-containing protein [Deltaproteobacteria bacterium]|nr:PEGA domain-containing protein [Deltaproteobacteria bacterium]